MFLALVPLLALSDAAVTTLGAIAVALIGGPLLVVVNRVGKHDKRDDQVATAIAALDQKVDDGFAGLSKQINRVEGRLDAHIDGRLVVKAGK